MAHRGDEGWGCHFWGFSTKENAWSNVIDSKRPQSRWFPERGFLMADLETQVPGGAVAEGIEPVPEGEAVPKAEASPAEPGKPKSENPEERPKAPEYATVAPKREMPESSFIAYQLRPPVVGAGEGGQNQRGAPGARLPNGPFERIRKFATSQTGVYAAVGIGLGLLVGLIVAAIFLHPAGAGAPNDMGAVKANEYGLKGQLTTSWKERLEFHLTVEPSAPALKAVFAANVNASPQPLSVDVQVKDPFGAVLCGDTVLLKFDPRNATGGSVAEPDPKASKTVKEIAARKQIAHGIDLARLEGQELDREHGKDVFQNNIGPDGQVASISAQGILPCTRKQFENIASWGFTSNFPMVAPPAGLQNPATDSDAKGAASTGAASEKRSDADKVPAAGKEKRRPAPPLPPIYIEGDDAIMGIDAANGMIETRDGKALVVEKTDMIVSTLKGRDFPVPIHYRCDQMGNCSFAGVGTGVHHARLKR
jgi:hypothetical protein